MSEDEGHRLVMRFLDGSPSFCNGFEMGQIWQSCKDGEYPSNKLIHTDNFEQVKLIAAHYFCTIVVEQEDQDGWMVISLIKNQIGLQLVKNEPKVDYSGFETYCAHCGERCSVLPGYLDGPVSECHGVGFAFEDANGDIIEINEDLRYLSDWND